MSTVVEDAAQRYGVVIAEAFMYRHHPQTLKVVELIDEGAIGRLQLIRGGFTFMLDRPDDIRLKPELGGGSIWDVGCYPISYARTAAGGIAPEEVFGWQVTGADRASTSPSSARCASPAASSRRSTAASTRPSAR